MLINEIITENVNEKSYHFLYINITFVCTSVF